MAYPDHETFAEHTGPGWSLSTDTQQALDVELIATEALPTQEPAESLRHVPFSLLFRTAPGVGVEQGMYRFSHAVLGELDIFVVPVGADEEGMRLEAIFN